jgi:hypothetical protein
LYDDPSQKHINIVLDDSLNKHVSLDTYLLILRLQKCPHSKMYFTKCNNIVCYVKPQENTTPEIKKLPLLHHTNGLSCKQQRLEHLKKTLNEIRSNLSLLEIKNLPYEICGCILQYLFNHFLTTDIEYYRSWHNRGVFSCHMYCATDSSEFANIKLFSEIFDTSQVYINSLMCHQLRLQFSIYINKLLIIDDRNLVDNNLEIYFYFGKFVNQLSVIDNPSLIDHGNSNFFPIIAPYLFPNINELSYTNGTFDANKFSQLKYLNRLNLETTNLSHFTSIPQTVTELSLRSLPCDAMDDMSKYSEYAYLFCFKNLKTLEFSICDTPLQINLPESLTTLILDVGCVDDERRNLTNLKLPVSLTTLEIHIGGVYHNNIAYIFNCIKHLQNLEQLTLHETNLRFDENKIIVPHFEKLNQITLIYHMLKANEMIFYDKFAQLMRQHQNHCQILLSCKFWI